MSESNPDEAEPADTGRRANRDDPPAAIDDNAETGLRAADDEAMASIDIEKINRALNLSFAPGAMQTVEGKERGGGPLAELLEELAEDMLGLHQRLAEIAHKQAALLAQTEQNERSVREQTYLHGRELDKLRRELLGERKALAALSTFSAISPLLDSLRAMHDNLDAGQDERMRVQLKALIQALTATLRGLGFSEFRAEVGEPFDPARMECVGYASGESGKVLAALSPGYCAQEAIVRPASVLLATPEDLASHPPTEESHE
jgi:molecular chaperone GrpE (heat shock protein)